MSAQAVMARRINQQQSKPPPRGNNALGTVGGSNQRRPPALSLDTMGKMGVMNNRGGDMGGGGQGVVAGGGMQSQAAPKISVANAIALTTLRLGKVEESLYEMQNGMNELIMFVGETMEVGEDGVPIRSTGASTAAGAGVAKVSIEQVRPIIEKELLGFKESTLKLTQDTGKLKQIITQISAHINNHINNTNKKFDETEIMINSLTHEIMEKVNGRLKEFSDDFEVRLMQILDKPMDNENNENNENNESNNNDEKLEEDTINKYNEFENLAQSLSTLDNINIVSADGLLKFDL